MRRFIFKSIGSSKFEHTREENQREKEEKKRRVLFLRLPQLS